MKRIAVLLLAAGESKRMGSVKQEMPYNGTPLVRHTAQTILECEPVQTIVVVGHRCEAVTALLDELDLLIVHNPNYKKGRMSSVAAGFRAISAECDGVMVCLADQPLIRVADLRFIADEFTKKRNDFIVVPTYNGKRGNPIVAPHAMLRDIEDGELNLGCRRLIENNPQRVTTVAMDSDRVLTDVDTPDDYRRVVGAVAPESPAKP